MERMGSKWKVSEKDVESYQPWKDIERRMKET
jgi:hypothetical protein